MILIWCFGLSTDVYFGGEDHIQATIQNSSYLTKVYLVHTRNQITKKKIMVNEIKSIVETVFGVPDFIVDHRKDEQMIPRHIFSYLLTVYTRLKPEQIGEITKRHRTTIYADVNATLGMFNDSRYRDKIIECINQVEAL